MAEQMQVLTDADLVVIDQALSKAEAVEEVIHRAEEAGIDVTAQAQRKRELETRLRQIKRAFFPGR